MGGGGGSGVKRGGGRFGGAILFSRKKIKMAARPRDLGRGAYIYYSLELSAAVLLLHFPADWLAGRPAGPMGVEAAGIPAPYWLVGSSRAALWLAGGRTAAAAAAAPAAPEGLRGQGCWCRQGSIRRDGL